MDKDKIIYNFSVNIEKDIEEEIEKKSKRKNKETGKMEVVTSKEKVTVKKEVPYNLIIEKPGRALLEEGDMFYSLELNKFIKMGLMTKAMLAKQYGNQGGVWSSKEQAVYAELVFKMHKHQLEIQQFNLLNKESKLSSRQQEKLDSLIKDLASIRKELTEYEMIQNSLFDHTADVKARNRTIMWYLLHLAKFQEGESEDAPIEDFFEGEDFDQKYADYADKEIEEDELFKLVIDKLSSIVTIWYIGGTQDQEGVDAILEEMQKDPMDDVIEESEVESSEELAEAVDENSG